MATEKKITPPSPPPPDRRSKFVDDGVGLSWDPPAPQKPKKPPTKVPPKK